MIRALPVFARSYGARGLVRRATHELRKMGNSFLSAPRRGSELTILPQATGTYRPRGSWSSLPESRRQALVDRGRRVANGAFEAYGHDWRPLPRRDGWRTHWKTGFVFPDSHWWRIPLSPPGSDVKDVWEPGRFSWAYDLIRAHAISGDSALAQTFYERLDEWLAANPPFRGVQWACGQETAIRALAVLHAADALPPTQGKEEQIQRMLASFFRSSGERVADAIQYGLSQRNNHGISETAGLVHLGLRIRHGDPDGGRWVARGKRLLEEQIADQFARDGWYAQHSFTYMRLALEQVLHAQAALEANGATLSAAALRLVDAGLDLIEAVIDPASGVVPNHGANDGGRAAPLSAAPYRDFRPLLTLGAVVRNRSLPADIDPDPEVVAWLGAGPSAGAWRPDGALCGASGWAVARVGRSAVFVRAGTYTHRPSHLDQLHIDVRIGGIEIVTDAGSLAYNADAPWKNALVTARVHNGPLLDDEEPAAKGPGFLWRSWPNARLTKCEYADAVATVVAETPGRVRRIIEIRPAEVSVSDCALDSAADVMSITWLLHPEALADGHVDVEGSQRIHATEADVVGWFSPTYALRLPSVAIVKRQPLREGRPAVGTIIRKATG